MPPAAPRVAVVGAGPSGLFAAQALLDLADEVHVDVLDRLPTPFGLVRYGVAPDHASIKSIQHTLAAPFASGRVRFLGLVEYGTDVSHKELVAGYDAVVYAVGASEDRRLGVPGEDLPGSSSAREFVAWYSGHPDAEPQSLAGVRSAIALGVGNVALDVARILLTEPDALRATDMPDAVMAELTGHAIRDVWVVGRRGPQHASFTTVELREILTLPDVAPILRAEDLAAVDETGLDRRVRGNLKALQEAADREVPDARARLHFAFWRRPVAIEGTDRVRRVVLEGTCLDDAGRVVASGEHEVIEAELVLRAIGYRGEPLPDLPFDERAGTIRNVEGRVVDTDGRTRRGEYVVGWIKRGPLGVIGTNKSDARATVRLLLEDLAAPDHRPPAGPDAVELLAARGHTPSTFADWEQIDAEEIARGSLRDRQRTKVETWHSLTDIIRHGRSGGPLEVEPDEGPGDGDER